MLRDYGRKKKNAFRKSVEKAYEMLRLSRKREEYTEEEVTHLEKRHKMDDHESSDSSDDSDSGSDSETSFSSDNSQYESNEDQNMMNACLTSMYQSGASSHDNSRNPSNCPSPIPKSALEDDDLFIVDRTGNVPAKNHTPKEKKVRHTNGQCPKCQTSTPDGRLCGSCMGRSQRRDVAPETTEQPEYRACGEPVTSQPSSVTARSQVTRDDDADMVTILSSDDEEEESAPAHTAQAPPTDHTHLRPVPPLRSRPDGFHSAAPPEFLPLPTPTLHIAPGLVAGMNMGLPVNHKPQYQKQPKSQLTRKINENQRKRKPEPTRHNADVSAENSDVVQVDNPSRAHRPPPKAMRGKPGSNTVPKSRPSNNKSDQEKKDQSEVEQTEAEVNRSSVRFSDFGGNETALDAVCRLLLHMRCPEVHKQLGVTPPRGFLLHGPPGCGKTLLAHAIAGELDLPFIKLAATEIVSGVSGESEEKIRKLFDKAVASAPCVVFLDEIDAITPKRETASKDMERRIVSQLLTCLDDLSRQSTQHVLVIGATNRPDSIDPSLRRAGRFDREISLGIPDENARLRILQVLCRDLRLSPGFDYRLLAASTPGYVGADLTALVSEAAMSAVNRIFTAIKTDPELRELEVGGSQSQNATVTPATSHKSSQSQLVGGGEKHTENPRCSTSLHGEGSSDAKLQSEESGHSMVQDEVRSSTEIDGENQKANGDIRANLSEDTNNVSVSSDVEEMVTEMPSSEQTGDQCVSDKGSSVTNTSQLTNTLETSVAHSSDKFTTNIRAEFTREKQEFLSIFRWLEHHPTLRESHLQDIYITQQDFQNAVKHVQPSAKREGFATVPDVSWDDIGALHSVREELQLAILAPVRHREQFSALGLTNPPGILLAGPPGCGKTLLAKAVANESGINFISVKGPELLNMYVGESERAVRQVFQRANNSSPCVIFFDELDALCPRRSDGEGGGASVRVVNQLLTEMDGLEERKQVFIMAATNRPDIIDPAVLRPGRLDKTLYVGLPNAQDRLDILNTITKNGTRPRLDPDVSLEAVANDDRCSRYTGADLAALVREASVCALREFLSNKTPTSHDITVNAAHYDAALCKVKPSVSEKDQRLYSAMAKGEQP